MRTNITPHRNFTTTLPDSVLQELDRAARELRVQKNDILVQALTSWNKRRRQILLAESYKRVKGKDRDDLIRLADEGLEDWGRNIPA